MKRAEQGDAGRKARSALERLPDQNHETSADTSEAISGVEERGARG